MKIKKRKPFDDNDSRGGWWGLRYGGVFFLFLFLKGSGWFEKGFSSLRCLNIRRVLFAVAKGLWMEKKFVQVVSSSLCHWISLNIFTLLFIFYKYLFGDFSLFFRVGACVNYSHTVDCDYAPVGGLWGVGDASVCLLHLLCLLGRLVCLFSLLWWEWFFREIL